MQPVPGWDTTPAYTGEVMQLPAGLYICIVKQVNIRQDAGGREQVVLLFDIAEGEQKGVGEPDGHDKGDIGRKYACDREEEI